MDVFIGTIMPWPINFVPMGWALCNGQTLPVSQNQALYSLIGNMYGGNSQYFALPDLRGRFPIGANYDVMGNRVMCSFAATGGQPAVILNPNNIPQHIHQITSNVNISGGGNVPVSMEVKIPVNTDAYDSTKATNTPNDNSTLGQGKAGNNSTNIYTTNNPTSGANLRPFTVQSNITVPNPTATVTSNCSPQPTTNVAVSIVPPFLSIYYIIAIEGLYPMRP